MHVYRRHKEERQAISHSEGRAGGPGPAPDSDCHAVHGCHCRQSAAAAVQRLVFNLKFSASGCHGAAGRGWDGLVQSNRSRNWNIGQVRFWRPDIEVCSTSTTKGYGNFKLASRCPAGEPESLATWQVQVQEFSESHCGPACD